MFDTIDKAIEELKAGRIVIVCDDQNRENEGDLVAIADLISPQAINFMITHGRGLVCMPIDQEYSNRFGLEAMVGNNTDNFNTAFTVSIDHISTTTGISAFDRANTILKLLDETSQSADFRRPGHIFPLVAKPGGVLKRSGHTEAAVDLARLCGRKSAGVICEIIKEDGSMARRDDLFEFAREHGLKIITIKDLIEYRKCYDKLVKPEARVLLPTKLGNFVITGYSNSLDSYEHVAITKGDLTSVKDPLVRIHSECLTGDVFHSLRCDCGEQLDNALSLIEKEQVGAVIYLRQEGRGIGLLNKLRAYELQEKGLDTVEANLKLGFADDLREYFLAAQILNDLGVKSVQLMTNNPAKVDALERYGIKVVKRVGLTVVPQEANAGYLKTKATKFGHFL